MRSELPGGPTETKVEFAAAPLRAQMNWVEMYNEVTHAPMKTIPDGAVKVYSYVLDDYEQMATRNRGTERTMKVIAIPSPWNTYPKAQIASALEFAGSITASVLKAMVPTSI